MLEMSVTRWGLRKEFFPHKKEGYGSKSPSYSKIVIDSFEKGEVNITDLFAANPDITFHHPESTIPCLHFFHFPGIHVLFFLPIV